jgi:hypothetical protein
MRVEGYRGVKKEAVPIERTHWPAGARADLRGRPAPVGDLERVPARVPDQARGPRECRVPAASCSRYFCSLRL